MKVFIDKNPLSGGHAVRGVGFYTKNLISSLEKIKKVKLVNNLQSADLVHYPYFDLFFPTLRKTKKPTVVTVHDVIPLLYPDHYPPGFKGKIQFFRQRQALKSVRQIITDSETSKKDIIRFLRVKPDKISVVYLAADKKFKKVENKKLLDEVRKKYRLPENFVFYVGDVNYNKNLETLCKACIKAKKYLVIAGKAAVEIKDQRLKNREQAHFKDLIKLFESEYINLLGFVPDEDLVVLHNLARIYVQPSLYEGFGLPPLQSLACGTPVIASKTNTLVEILGDAAFYFDPTDINALVKLLKKDSLKAGQLPRKYSWKKTAEKTFEVYQKALL